MTRAIAMLVALTLAVAACGDGTDDGVDANVADQSTSTEDTVPSGETDEVTSPPADGEGSGPSTATVTLGGETYTFSSEASSIAQCKTDLFGVFSAQLSMVDGEGGIQVVILHDDTDPAVIEQRNELRVSIGDEDWQAAEVSDLFDVSDNLEAGMSQVDSAEFDGRTVRGTATFVRQMSVFMGEVETATGSFEATCGEERLS